jgi:hypothetical protein
VKKTAATMSSEEESEMPMPTNINLPWANGEDQESKPLFRVERRRSAKAAAESGELSTEDEQSSSMIPSRRPAPLRVGGKILSVVPKDVRSTAGDDVPADWRSTNK